MLDGAQHRIDAFTQSLGRRLRAIRTRDSAKPPVCERREELPARHDVEQRHPAASLSPQVDSQGGSDWSSEVGKCVAEGNQATAVLRPDVDVILQHARVHLIRKQTEEDT